MNAVSAGITISSVNMDDRKAIGIKAGDTVRVHQKIQDKGKTRIQMFEGLVLARKHGNEPGATFTVRKIVDGIGVEKIFPLYSPMIDKIEIIRRSKVRRAKLYYIRDKVAREIKRQMRRMQMVELATQSEVEVAARAEAKKEEAKKAEAEAKTAEENVKKISEETNSTEKTSKEKTEERVEEKEQEKQTEETPEKKKEQIEEDKKE